MLRVCVMRTGVHSTLTVRFWFRYEGHFCILVVLRCFDVVFTCLFQFAMCFVFTDCPVLCFVSVRSTHGLLGRHFGFWLVCSPLAGVFVVPFSVLCCFLCVRYE